MAKYLVALLFSLVSLDGFSLEIKKLDEYTIRYGFSDLYLQVRDPKKQLTIAIIDNGFSGYKKEIGKTLPRQTKYIPRSKSSTPSTSTHGLTTAQIYTAFVADGLLRSDLEPQVYLIEVKDASDFPHAMDEVLARNVDIVVHTPVYEVSDKDARNINFQVKRATDAGVVWVNASGNFGMTSYSSAVGAPDRDGTILIPTENNAITVMCDRENCEGELSLIWNTNQNGTTADLDLILLDKDFKTLSNSGRTKPGELREIIYAKLPRGRYYLIVKDRGHNFEGSGKIRILAEGHGLRFLNYTSDESVFAPADSPYVITVGAIDTNASSESKSKKKPEILSPSRIETDKGVILGSSSAAAIVAAKISLMKMRANHLGREGLIARLTGRPERPAPAVVARNTPVETKPPPKPPLPPIAKIEPQHAVVEAQENLKKLVERLPEEPKATPVVVPVVAQAKAPEKVSPTPKQYIVTTLKKEKEFVPIAPIDQPDVGARGVRPAGFVGNPNFVKTGQRLDTKKISVVLRDFPRPPPPPPPAAGVGISAHILGLIPTNSTCYEMVAVGAQEPYVEYLILHGAVVVDTKSGLRLMTNYDPITFFPGKRRWRTDDMIVASPEGLRLIPRTEINKIPNYWIEVFQAPKDFPMCSQVRA